VITRTMKRVVEKVGQTETKFRSRVRSVQHRLIELGKLAAHRGEKARARREQVYRKLMRTTRRVISEAGITIKQASIKIKKETDQRRQAAAQKLIDRVQTTICLTEQVMKQTRARVIKGQTHYEEKLVSIFETKTEVIRKGKASRPTEFGKIVKIQEAENQIITDYEVFESKPADQALLIPAIDRHEEIFGKVPDLVATDGGFHSISNVEAATERGVKRLAVPGRRGRGSGKSKKRKERWYREAQRWRVGCEGRISVLKRRTGLFRSRYKGTSGMKRWVGFGVIADNLISLGTLLSST
jgi:IS5 family transposase